MCRHPFCQEFEWREAFTRLRLVGGQKAIIRCDFKFVFVI
ncbi:unnamed protein product [Brassica rapa subsp. narinosa]